MTRLVARTRLVEDTADLIDKVGEEGLVWSHRRLQLGAYGVARRISLPAGSAWADAVGAAFDEIDVDDAVGSTGTGPLALGALPFSATVTGTLAVPEVLHGSDDQGRSWVTTVTPDGTDPSALPAASSPPPVRHDVTPILDEAEWCDRVAAARDDLRSGVAHKVVLARALAVLADGPISRVEVLRRLRLAYPDCYLFAMPELVGASPELLVAREDLSVRSHPMAGTVRRSGDAELDADRAAGLLASAKDRVEHQITIDRVHETLLPFCSYLDAEPEPSVTTLANLHHLSSLVEGRLARPAASVLELVAALHPTPAVCGEPREAALSLIERYEGFDRGCYAGPVGWVDRHGNGEWAVGIRSAEIVGSTARLFAGVGVVEDSDPLAELDETRVKFEPMLAAITGP